MSPSTDTRERREFASEIKFLVDPAVAEQIRRWARANLAPDPHAGGVAGDAYRITSLYFDTAQSDVYYRRGSYGRSKYRVRRYGGSDFVFLERKLKTRGLLAKRRSVLPIAGLEGLSAEYPQRDSASFWFHRRLLARRLAAVCQVSYDRTARVAMTVHGPIRLTLDEKLQALPADGLRFIPEEGIPLLSDQLILEMKFRREAPALFKYLVAEFALNLQPLSKYRLAAEKLRLVSSGRLRPQPDAIRAHA